MFIVVNADEERVANALLIKGALVVHESYPRTHERLQSLGMPLRLVDTSEFRKMDGD